MRLSLQLHAYSALTRCLGILLGLMIAAQVSAAPIITSAGSFSNPCGLTPPTVSPASATVTVGSPFSITATGCAGGIIQYFGSNGVYTVAPGGTISVPTSATGTIVIPTACSKSGCLSDIAEAVITVAPAGDPNAAQRPFVSTPIGTQNATVGSNFTFIIPANTFTDPNNNPLTLTAAGLPDGLTFNGLVITGPPASPGISQVTITATNSLGLAINTTFTIIVSGAAPAQSDLTPTIDLPQANFAATSPNNSRDFVVEIAELDGFATSTGNVIFTVTAPTGYSISFSNSITSINVSGGLTNPVAVDNTKWSVTNNAQNQQLTLTINGGEAIAGFAKVKIGFTLTRTSANSGSTSNIVVNVNDDATNTYDNNSANNIYSRIISGL
ncbi:hypothetical protein EXU85_08550 [Spirosoma sp. KCTC 42546]|uniref:putative Ig domain-containing protein n=1 Tax=Spirosoma sp. KCTC 42546 TaxID=2520506 RepID=UPI00115A5897|nr:putative Ig domain-containing protein [Spirosoma sp. KCTC 42546]QDK78659.1 hypothetical protein EXU85_08550 [Spirosoma sp. KCTC 42546]